MGFLKRLFSNTPGSGPDKSKMVPIPKLVDNRTYHKRALTIENSIYDRIKMHRRAIERMQDRIRTFQNNGGSVYPEDVMRVAEIRKHIGMVNEEIDRLVVLLDAGYEYESEVKDDNKVDSYQS